MKWSIGALALQGFGCGGGTATATDDGAFAKEDHKDKKELVCHIPPGNPDNLHTICISKKAVKAHLAHGDYEGRCTTDPPDEDYDGCTEEEEHEETCNGKDDDKDGEVDEGCLDQCPAPSVCLSLFQAAAKGSLLIQSQDRGGAILFQNVGDEDVCLDENSLIFSPDSQSFFLDQGVLDAGVRLRAGEDVTLWYGSWTTDNGEFSPYLDEYAWWCFQTALSTAADVTYDFEGSGVPPALSAFVSAGADVDANGVADLVEWNGSEVEAQANLWAYQESHGMLTVGKSAALDGPEIEVVLVVRNIGRVAASGVLSDTIPAGWDVTSCGDAPLSKAKQADGSVLVKWNVQVAGYASATTSGTFSRTVAYRIKRKITVDKPYLELASASVDFDDGLALQHNVSLRAAVYDYDFDGDGKCDCKP